jgi:hypothetical protein
MAPQVGFEPTTLRLTAECSAIELLRSVETGPKARSIEIIIAFLLCSMHPVRVQEVGVLAVDFLNVIAQPMLQEAEQRRRDSNRT